MNLNFYRVNTLPTWDSTLVGNLYFVNGSGIYIANSTGFVEYTDRTNLQTSINGKLSKATSEDSKEYFYTYSGSTQNTDKILINDLISTPSSLDDDMIPTAKGVGDAVATRELSSNKVTSLSSSSTDTQFASAKCVYDAFGNKIVNQTGSTAEIAPNVMNLWGEIASLTITLATASDANRTNEYMLQFTSPSSAATTFSYPNTITWAESNATTISSSVVVPNIEAGKTYQISIVNNKGIIGGF